MKKLLSLILVVIFAFAVQAQSVMTQTDPAGASASVNTNGDTSYHRSDLAGQTFNYQYITITVAGTKSSGTISGGAATLWGSNDGTNWFAVYAQTNASTADTTTSQTLTDGSNNFVYIITGTKWRYYRVRVITTGTQVSAYVCRLLGRKVPN